MFEIKFGTTKPVIKRVDIRALKIAITVLITPEVIDIIEPVEFLSHEECCILYPSWVSLMAIRMLIILL